MNCYTYVITHPCATYTYQDEPGWSEVTSAEEGGTRPRFYPDVGNPDPGPLVCAVNTLPKEPSPSCLVLVQPEPGEQSGFSGEPAEMLRSLFIHCPHHPTFDL